MGSAASKPIAAASSSSSTSQGYSEKTSTTTQLASNHAQAVSTAASQQHHHHAADRLARIQAESSHRYGRWSEPPSSSSSHNSSTHAEAQVSLEAVQEWSNAAFALPTSRLAALTLQHADIPTSLHRRAAEVATQHVFSHTIPFECAKVTNQKRSGRCWLFATTNLIRNQAAQKLDLDNFELSQSYLSFYDKLEKANFFLENMIELIDVPFDDRVVNSLLSSPVNDGGQWDMVANLLSKYGVVPQAVFPESYSSSDSGKINWLVTVKLREYTVELREIKKDLQRRLDRTTSLGYEAKAAAIQRAQRQRKDEQMEEVYRIMAITLGAPPKPDDEFTYNYKTKGGKFQSITATPKTFLRDHTDGFDHVNKCSLVNDPRHAEGRLMTVDRLGNVWGGSTVKYVNTSMDVMSDAVVASIKAGKPVFFGCDVGQSSDRATGIMDASLFDYELPFNIRLGLTKAQRIELGESSMTHAMTITAVHIEEGKVVRFRVENSWGEENVGEKGYFVMTREWLNQFAYQVVIDKRFVPKTLWKLFERGVDDETIVVPVYDPMGALA